MHRWKSTVVKGNMTPLYFTSAEVLTAATHFVALPALALEKTQCILYQHPGVDEMIKS